MSALGFGAHILILQEFLALLPGYPHAYPLADIPGRSPRKQQSRRQIAANFAKPAASLPRQKLRNPIAGLLDRKNAIEVAVTAFNLDVLDRCAIRLYHLLGLVHRVGLEYEIVVAANEENGSVDLLETLGKIAAARDKKLTCLDQVKEVVGVGLRNAVLPVPIKLCLNCVLGCEKT